MQLMKATAIMFTYAVVLLVLGFVAYAMSGFESKAATALYASGGLAALMFLVGLMAMAIKSSKIVGMIGIHVGMVLPLLFSFSLAWMGWMTFQKYQEGLRPIHVPVIMWVMAAVSVVAFFMILACRDKNAEKQSTG